MNCGQPANLNWLAAQRYVLAVHIANNIVHANLPPCAFAAEQHSTLAIGGKYADNL